MIYTVTLNPSLDYVMRVADFQIGTVNRTSSEQILCGGKGINVSAVLHNFGIKSVALGFAGGFIGEEIERRIQAIGCETEFIRVPGNSRINIKLKAGEETDINASGPELNQSHLECLIRQIKEKLQDGDTLILAGSVPHSLPESAYSDILARLSKKRVLAVVDAEKKLLRNALQCRPFLVKPNLQELEGLFGKRIDDLYEVYQCAELLQQEGAQNVLVSMAGDGAALLTHEGKKYFLSAPKGQVKNSTGAGDSMIAGFLAGYQRTRDLWQALRLGVAAGSASAFSDGLATRKEVQELLERIPQENDR